MCNLPQAKFRLPKWCLPIALMLALTGCAMPSDMAAEPIGNASATMPADTDTSGSDDSLYDLDHVLEVSIDMPPADWDALRLPYRTIADIVGGADCLARPKELIFDWHAADITIDGQAFAQAGVRKKGFYGSLSEDKPSLKIRLDKYNASAFDGGVTRFTFNNAKQDRSVINTCMAYHVFTAPGLAAPRCNFATVEVNGENLGLFVYVEEIKEPFLERHFGDAGGSLYEGTVSDFNWGYRGTFEKKNNEETNDWSDIEAVTAALADPSPAGLETLAALVNLEQFLTFWAVEVLLGHWDGYAGNRNNFYIYRAPGQPFAFIPWGADQVMGGVDNPLDGIPTPTSVYAHGDIAYRLYADPDGRAAYVARLRDLLANVWDEEELTALANRMAGVVADHLPPAARTAATKDANRVYKFIAGREEAVLADLMPEPPDWPWPQRTPEDICVPERGSFVLGFETAWGTDASENPAGEGAVVFDHYRLGGHDVSFALSGATAGLEEAPAEGWDETLGALDDLGNKNGVFDKPDHEAGLEFVPDLPPFDEMLGWADVNGDGSIDRGEWESITGVGAEDSGGTRAVISIISLGVDDEADVLTVTVPMEDLYPGAEIAIEFETGNGFHTDAFGTSTIAGGLLEIIEVGFESGTVLSGRLSGTIYGHEGPSEPVDGPVVQTPSASSGLVINEVAAKGDPLDWLELHNASDDPIDLSGYLLADDLEDPDKRVAFPPDLVLAPGAYLQVRLEKDGWPGFALGSDEEVGIWTADGNLVDQVDWEDGQSGEDASFARVPDARGEFRTVANPTPGEPNPTE
ncbi:MAG: CotH kinase family protein [Caldilineaceae bacterium]|nr:CotH kinase family protein [Caldilineaceae bacterium]